MNGPYRQPPSWPTQTIAPSGYDLALLHLPHTDPKVAMAFSIKQTGSDGKDKIRRGEDWRRSGHNSTCIMHDQPFHHTPDHFASLVMQTHQTHPTADMHVWGHDHDGAYRQLPWTTPRMHTCCYTHHRGPHYGATMSCSLVPWPAFGGTTDSATPWSPFLGSSSCAPQCITLMTMGAPKSPSIPHRASKLSRISMGPWAIE